MPIFAGGRHSRMVHPQSGKIVPIPIHGSKDISIGLIRIIIRELGITPEEWLETVTTRPYFIPLSATPRTIQRLLEENVDHQHRDQHQDRGGHCQVVTLAVLRVCTT